MNNHRDTDEAILATLRKIERNGNVANFLLSWLVMFLVFLPVFKPALQAIGWWNVFGLPE